MSDINNIKNISNTSATQNIISKCLNLSSQGKKDTGINTYKTKTNFDTDKSLINIPRQLVTKSNDLCVVNTNSILNSVDSSNFDKSEISKQLSDETVSQDNSKDDNNTRYISF
jgi:hypothetical protein